MRTSTLLLAAALAVTLVACGGTQAKSGMAGETPAAPAHVQPQTPNQQIDQLSQQISDWRVQLGMPALPGEDVIDAAGAEPMRQPMATDDVEAIEDPTCRDVCTLAASICDNAERICRIAEDELPGDAWAAGKCSEATASCAEAQENCDSCAGE